MPLFITANIDEKLDPSDADFVDVIHTNALVQGKIERCGHVDFYMNGGIMQPGCMSNGNSKFYLFLLLTCFAMKRFRKWVPTPESKILIGDLVLNAIV